MLPKQPLTRWCAVIGLSLESLSSMKPPVSSPPDLLREHSQIWNHWTSESAREQNIGASHEWPSLTATYSVLQCTNFFTNRPHAQSPLTKHWKSPAGFRPTKPRSSSMVFSTRSNEISTMSNRNRTFKLSQMRAVLNRILHQ